MPRDIKPCPLDPTHALLAKHITKVANFPELTKPITGQYLQMRFPYHAVLTTDQQVLLFYMERPVDCLGRPPDRYNGHVFDALRALVACGLLSEAERRKFTDPNHPPWSKTYD